MVRWLLFNEFSSLIILTFGFTENRRFSSFFNMSCPYVLKKRQDVLKKDNKKKHTRAHLEDFLKCLWLYTIFFLYISNYFFVHLCTLLIVLISL